MMSVGIRLSLVPFLKMKYRATLVFLAMLFVLQPTTNAGAMILQH